LKDSGNPQEAAEAREAEQQIRQALAAADGSGSSTCGVLYNRDVVVATKQQAAHPHNLLKLLNGGMLPYTFDKKVGVAGGFQGRFTGEVEGRHVVYVLPWGIVRLGRAQGTSGRAECVCMLCSAWVHVIGSTDKALASLCIVLGCGLAVQSQ